LVSLSLSPPQLHPSTFITNGSSEARAKEIICSTDSILKQGISVLQASRVFLDFKKLKKKLIEEKSFNENASVGHTPTHPPQSIQSDGVNAGVLSTISIVETGHTSTHLLHSDNLLVALIQEATSNFNLII
jgi:hypothetical protein